MHATAATPEATAAALLGLWKRIMSGGASRGLVTVMEELDLSLTQVKVLMALDGCGCELSVKQLADRIPTSLPNASRTAEALLQRGYLERQEDPADRRQKLLRISPAGHEVVTRVEEVRLKDMTSFTRSLSDDDRALLLSTLTRLEETS